MRSYLLKINGKVAERPQHMLMRVSVGIHQNDIDAAIETYNLLSEKWFTHASPTLFNAGTCKPQMSSCFLLTMSDDSIDGIYDTLTTCARISKSAGGIGINMHNIRASGSYIAGVRRFNFFQGSSEYLLKVNQSDLRILLSSLLHVHMFEISTCDSSELIILIKGICLNFFACFHFNQTNGVSNGLVPMLRVYNATARYVDQGGNKRPGAFAIYLEPWHADIIDFLDLRKNTGKEEQVKIHIIHSSILFAPSEA